MTQDIVYVVNSCTKEGETPFFATIDLDKAKKIYEIEKATNYTYYEIEKYVDGNFDSVIEDNKPFRWYFG